MSATEIEKIKAVFLKFPTFYRKFAKIVILHAYFYYF